MSSGKINKYLAEIESLTEIAREIEIEYRMTSNPQKRAKQEYTMMVLRGNVKKLWRKLQNEKERL